MHERPHVLRVQQARENARRNRLLAVWWDSYETLNLERGFLRDIVIASNVLRSFLQARASVCVFDLLSKGVLLLNRFESVGYARFQWQKRIVGAYRA